MLNIRQARTVSGEVVGYVLSKLEDGVDNSANSGDSSKHGHITSISVMRKYRRLGLAKKLMLNAQQMMKTCYGVSMVSLHVRVSNTAAIHLYTKTLGFRIDHTEKKYYADGEDAYSMQLDL
ncbi:hypothetical protein BB560_001486 [Smittium megazygosporum]|uniref:N-acetyltransferase domain-containing protein n=1 Tax=Smittium megazygosporum TaxID=133381 RepID=A0A2T9ZHH9_9FUNG|nr:hypothetical protein BB560_001486 [Smittium megazygosporum]